MNALYPPTLSLIIMLAAGAWAVPGAAMSSRPQPVRIACVGDSITWGYHVPHRLINAYPVVLQRLAGPAYVVRGFGHSGATALKHPTWNFSYWKVAEFKQATAFKPDVVIVMLGTNDSNHGNLAVMRRYFSRDFTALIRHFQKLSTNPKVFVCLPPSLGDGTITGPHEAVPKTGVAPRIVAVAKKLHLPLINLLYAMGGRWKLFNSDHIHPNIQGQKVLAMLVDRALVRAGVVARRKGR